MVPTRCSEGLRHLATVRGRARCPYGRQAARLPTQRTSQFKSSVAFRHRENTYRRELA